MAQINRMKIDKKQARFFDVPAFDQLKNFSEVPYDQMTPREKKKYEDLRSQLINNNFDQFLLS